MVAKLGRSNVAARRFAKSTALIIRVVEAWHPDAKEQTALLCPHDSATILPKPLLHDNALEQLICFVQVSALSPLRAQMTVWLTCSSLGGSSPKPCSFTEEW